MVRRERAACGSSSFHLSSWRASGAVGPDAQVDVLVRLEAAHADGVRPRLGLIEAAGLVAGSDHARPAIEALGAHPRAVAHQQLDVATSAAAPDVEAVQPGRYLDGEAVQLAGTSMDAAPFGLDRGFLHEGLADERRVARDAGVQPGLVPIARAQAGARDAGQDPALAAPDHQRSALV